jgi:DNA adenine methylase
MNHTEALTEITSRLKTVLIEKREASKVCSQHDRIDTLHYLDPPYPGATRRDNSGNFYQHEAKSLDDHYAIFKWANELIGYVLVSGYNCPEYDQWFGEAGWEKREKKAITGAALKGNSHATEVLWLNPRCAAQQKQLRIF